MIVMLISQCSKNALKETRRILDQFAERRGDRTWQTPITQEGLKTLHKMLRKTARKNTAVACHRLRGSKSSELIWIVGDVGRFNEQGAVPTNTTSRDILRAQAENDWHTAEEIRLLAVLAALFHDFGKGNQAFQHKLTKGGPLADAFRHEWASLRLFEAFVDGDSDEEWLGRLASESEILDKKYLNNLLRDRIDNRLQGPFISLPPLARVVGWLIVSHHRLPTQEWEAPLQVEALNLLPATIEEQWCGSLSNPDPKDVKACWSFMKGLPFDSLSWRRQASRAARQILNRPGMTATNLFGNPFILHLSRLALMLADHFYSGESGARRYGEADYPLYANTNRETGSLNQRLDEHLIGVAVNAGRIVRMLPRLEQRLPRIARHKGFRTRTRDPVFRWQDRSFDLAEGLRNRSAGQGFFGVNMASTGCGKTLANGRIMYALSNPRQGARFSIALGLRTLTLQTGEVYREQMGLGEEDLAVLVGGGTVKELYEHRRKADFRTTSGSESGGDIFPDHNYVHYEGSLEDGPLNRWLDKSPNLKKMLNAPVLVCTIDHLSPAVEGVRGGRQIAPMLRLSTSDLVLDEPDDFSVEDLPALTRLVHWAGLLGSRVLLSSATLPPALVQGLFQAYLEGRRNHQNNRGVPNRPLNVCCAWFDEFGVMAGDHADGESFKQQHKIFIKKRLDRLTGETIRRRAEIAPVPIAHGIDREKICAELAEILHRYSHELHQKHHSVDPITAGKISFGLIRMANIDPLVETARALCALGAEKNHRIHICIYHSQHPLLVRSAIEQRLDLLLNRKNENAVFFDPSMRRLLDHSSEDNHIFITISTAVAEVGRDHDYDWGIVEPSSMRSIIQLAGRIRRHRPGSCLTPNLYLLDVNTRYLLKGAGPAFCRPGFENERFLLKSHHLSKLLSTESLAVIDASSRIYEKDDPDPENNLADLEHERIRALMIGEQRGHGLRTAPAHWWWTTNAALSGEMQRVQKFRNDPLGRRRYGLLPDENGEIRFNRFESDGVLTPVHDNLLHSFEVEPGPRLSFWGAPDYAEALEDLAVVLDMETGDCARRFGVIDLPAKGVEQGWLYNPFFGFSRFR